MVLGDVTNLPMLFLRHPEWQVAFDPTRGGRGDPPQYLRSRRRRQGASTGYHWGMPGAGTVAKDGNGYALVPVKA